ncbi:J domain-containing protein [Halorussus limi]|uniref:J domain-containing protein n=1 Tax=Halorussus limi TaxID=2938695 RepID=A0A8U0HYW9_9EURY|nr:DnaJ domain-containing protein [Halorussus limi]UPV75891.1 J domain-containing protein [Halorussus limi]
MTDLDWPAGFDRTDAVRQTTNDRFEISLSKAFDELETELDRLGVKDGTDGAPGYRYSFDAPQRQTDQRPYARANPDDPGFVLQWTMDGNDYAVACDRYSRLRDNVRTVGLYVREKRKMEERPVETGESEFANARLPSGNENADAVVAHEPPHEVLGVARDAAPEVVRGAARQLKKKYHPDAGGDEERFKRVVDAENAMLDGRGER